MNFQREKEPLPLSDAWKLCNVKFGDIFSKL